MVRIALPLLLLIVATAAGCSRDGGLRCDDPGRYLGSVSVPPIRVPDDLDLPEEIGALRIPDDPGQEPEPVVAEESAGEEPAEQPACAEAPPKFDSAAED